MAQRHSDCKEVCFYRMQWGKPSMDKRYAFPLEVAEIKFATAKFKVLDRTHLLEASFWLVNGFLFSITFKRSPKAYLNEHNIQLEALQIHHNPMEKVSPVEMKGRSELPLLKGSIALWSKQHPFTSLKAPLVLEARERIKQNLSAKLPEDYMSAIRVRHQGHPPSGSIRHQGQASTIDFRSFCIFPILRWKSRRVGSRIAVKQVDERSRPHIGAKRRWIGHGEVSESCQSAH